MFIIRFKRWVNVFIERELCLTSVSVLLAFIAQQRTLQSSVCYNGWACDTETGIKERADKLKLKIIEVPKWLLIYGRLGVITRGVACADINNMFGSLNGLVD